MTEFRAQTIGVGNFEPAPRACLRNYRSALSGERLNGVNIERVRGLAIEYYKLTGKPLGVTGEMAEVEAARLLNLRLCSARQDGYDAIESVGSTTRFIQIKGRRLVDGSKPGQRLGEIRIDKEWTSVMLVLLDENYRATEIYEAERDRVRAEIERPGSKARNERGALSVTLLKRIGKIRWPLNTDRLKSGRTKEVSGIRARALQYLAERIKDSGRFAKAIGVNQADGFMAELGKRVVVSKLFLPPKSATGKHSWWHKVSVDKLRFLRGRKLVLTCARPESLDFHVLSVPVDWVLDGLGGLDSKGGILQLFLDPNPASQFVDRRGRGRLNFGKWLVE